MSEAYYAKGMEIWKSPVSTDNGDGTTSISIGFKCATAAEIVGEEGAQAIAEMLTLSGTYLASVVEERDRLRKVVSDCAAALGNGAFISTTCSLEFMEQLPKEISLVVTGLRADLEAKP